MTRALAMVVSLCALGSAAMAQTAVMLDGRVLTMKVPASPFATEGPIWNLDLANQGILVTGKKVTIAKTVNGTPLDEESLVTRRRAPGRSTAARGAATTA